MFSLAKSGLVHAFVFQVIPFPLASVNVSLGVVKGGHKKNKINFSLYKQTLSNAGFAAMQQNATVEPASSSGSTGGHGKRKFLSFPCFLAPPPPPPPPPILSSE